jgi:hypothetical protein
MIVKRGIRGRHRLPGGDAIFERFGQLLVDELQGKTFLEVSYHPGLHLAEQDQRFQRRAVFRGDGRAQTAQGNSRWSGSR